MASIPQKTLTLESRRAELSKVLESNLFTRAPVLGHFLSYLCEKSFAGQTNEIKEYSIAVDVFGRDPTFDQDTDSIVRVHANRLRKRLAEYYATLGAADPIHITIPVGQYVPTFAEVAVPEVPEPVPLGPEPVAEPAPAAPKRYYWRVLVSLALVAVIATGVFIGSRRAPQNARSDVESAPDLPAGLPAGDEVRILAGATHAYVDRSGKMWSEDKYFAGGEPVKAAVQRIWRAPETALYRSSRQGEFSYDIPLKPGVYEVRLHFAETYFGPEEAGGGGEGSRVMNVTANGKPLLASFDVAADSGASRTADMKVFTDLEPSKDGKLHLKFSPAYGASAMVSAIEILPGLHERIRPIRIATRSSPYYSIDSHWWSPDNYYKGGQLGESQEQAAGTEDPELYQSERWGNFSYAIPVPPGKYDVVLHFIDRRAGSQSSGAATGGRYFNVFCNGKLILNEFQPAKEAGRNHPVVKTFSSLQPNAQGKLVFDFVPIRDYATVTAIEVIPQ